MKFYKEYILITFMLLRALNEVQGNSSGLSLKNEDFPSTSIKFDEQDNISAGNQGTVNSNENGYLHTFSATPDPKKKMPTISNIPKRSTNPVTSKEKWDKYIKTKSHDTEVRKIAKNSYHKENKKETLKLILPVRRAFPTQRIFCRQITKSEINTHGVIIESVQHICAPLPAAIGNGKPSVFSTFALPNGTTEKTFGNLVTSTPKGINCRRVMNSEFNDLGEIVDSVTEVCDTPPTTTTTSKPIINTTPKATTTTPKPLVKICRLVMDSYLSDEGKIIDSVTILCKMEQVS